MKKILLGLGIIILTLQSCLHVFQPLITEKDLVAEKSLNGKWTTGKTALEIQEYGASWLKKELNVNTSSSTDSLTPQRIRDSIVENHLTHLLTFQDSYFMYAFTMQATRINNDLYAHIMPVLKIPVKDGKVETGGSDISGDRYNALTALEIKGSFAFARIIKHGDNNFTVKFFDGEKLSQLMRSGKMKVPYEFDPVFNNFLVTAETPDLRTLVSKYGDNEDLYSKQYSFELTRTR